MQPPEVATINAHQPKSASMVSTAPTAPRDVVAPPAEQPPEPTIASPPELLAPTAGKREECTGGASGNAIGNVESAKEAFLLRQEVQQLRKRLDGDLDKVKELAALRSERDALRAEVEAARASQARADRAQQSERRQSREEVDALRGQLAESRAQERRLQEQLLQRDSLSDANAQLLSENERLKEQIARAQVASSNSGSHGIGIPIGPRLQPLNEGLARLAELSASLDQALAAGPEEDPPIVRARQNRGPRGD